METPLFQLLLAPVVDQQAIGAEPDSGRGAVCCQLAVMHEMPDRDAAGDLSEVGDEPPVASPPDALTAHHREMACGGLGEHVIDGGQEVRLPHVPGVTPEGRLPPRHIR